MHCFTFDELIFSDKERLASEFPVIFKLNLSIYHIIAPLSGEQFKVHSCHHRFVPRCRIRTIHFLLFLILQNFL